MFLTYLDVVHAQDRIAYVTVLAACAGARQWDEALDEFSFLPLWIGTCGMWHADLMGQDGLCTIPGVVVCTSNIYASSYLRPV